MPCPTTGNVKFKVKEPSNQNWNMVLVEAPHTASAESADGFVDGFLLPSNLSYHSGHSWLARERKGVVRIGADESMFRTALEPLSEALAA